MPFINYEQFTNEPNDENVGISVITIPDQAVDPPASLIVETNNNRAVNFDKYRDCFKSTAFPKMCAKLCIILVIVVHLALAAFVLIFWNTHSHNGSFSKNK